LPKRLVAALKDVAVYAMQMGKLEVSPFAAWRRKNLNLPQAAKRQRLLEPGFQGQAGRCPCHRSPQSLRGGEEGGQQRHLGVAQWLLTRLQPAQFAPRVEVLLRQRLNDFITKLENRLPPEAMEVAWRVAEEQTTREAEVLDDGGWPAIGPSPHKPDVA
jgi:hypothetical protein